MAEEFDLIPANEKCDTFKVVFDYYSPRAHFIILPRNEFISTYFELDQKARPKVVKSALSIVSGYKLQKSAILSIHFGSWLTTKDKFHAHICVDVDNYLLIFEENKQRIPGWPSSDYVTKQWIASKNRNDYPMNVRGYPFKSYFKEEVKAIKDYRRPLTAGSDSPCPQLPPNFSPHQSEQRVGFAVEKSKDPSSREYRRSPTGESDSSCPPLPFALLFHPSEPRVGFAVEKSKEPSSRESKFEALEAMINFAEKNNLTNIKSKDDNEGCHVCLVLDGRSNGKSILVNLP